MQASSSATCARGSRAGTSPTTELVDSLRAELQRAADPAKAPGMQAYMKSPMPFLGVPAPAMRHAVRAALAAHALDTEAWREQVLALWRGATYREERYAALELARRFQRSATPDDLALYEELVVSGAWWDMVDSVARLVGGLLRRFPEPVATAMREWAHDDDLWKRRVSIICQLGFRADTDLGLLHACIEPSLGRPEFFLRKAIGWALRDLAWSNPADVERYVHENRSRLSPLSVREATKHLARLLA